MRTNCKTFALRARARCVCRRENRYSVLVMMSLQRKTVEAFQLLEVEQLPAEWIADNWEQNFCESIVLPTQVSESIVTVDTWRSVVEACREWLILGNNVQESEDTSLGSAVGFWSTLIDCGITYKSLLALIFYLLDRKNQVISVECSVRAAQTYLLMLRLPGSTAFKIFQPVIFEKTLNIVYLLSAIQTALDGSGVEGEGEVRGRGRQQRKRRGGGRNSIGKHVKRRRGRRGVENDEEQDSMMEDTSSVVELSQSEKNAFISDMAKDMLQFSESCPLSSSEVTWDQLVQVALHLLTQHTTGTNLTIQMLTNNSTEYPVEVLGWKLLVSLALNYHKEAEKFISKIFLQLLPTVLMLNSDGTPRSSGSSSLPLSLTVPSNNSVVFVSHLVSKCGETMYSSLKGLVQQICTRTPDKLEYRNRMATIVCKLLTLFTDKQYSYLLEWLSRVSKNIKVSYRVFAVEVVSELLNYPLRQPPEGALSGEEEYRLSYKYLIKISLSRCSDIAPTVRARALASITAAASSTNAEVVTCLKKINSSQTLADPLITNNQESMENLIVPMVRTRTEDEKVRVRRNAVQTLEAIIRLDMDNIKKEDVLAIHERCMDTALSVRKQALVILSSLTIDLPQCKILHELWLDGVLPMVMDKEPSVQEKCTSILESIFLHISPHNAPDADSSHQRFVWDLLSLVAEEDRMDLRRYIRRAADLWFKQNKLSKPFVRAVCSHTSHSGHQIAAWTLLAEMSQYIASQLDSKFLYDNWKLHSSEVSMETTVPLVQILIVIGNATKQALPKVSKEIIRDEIVSMLDTFQLSPVVIHASIITLSQICNSLTGGDRKKYQKAIDSWSLPLLNKCEHYLSNLIENYSQTRVSENGTSDGGREVNEKEVTCYIFSVGELCQLSPGHTSSHLSLMIHSLLLATREGEEGRISFRSVSSQSSQTLSGLSNLNLPSSLRALGYITLGKLCLQNEDLTKKVIPQLVHDLETSPHAAIRNNIVVILCDLSVRYSVKVDPYIPNIAVCLKDESLLVRRQTLTLLANLTQEDYIKWKGALFFRFLSTLLDEKLRAFAEFCLVHIVLSRTPNIFFQHFIECIFHFNEYEKHRVFNKFKQTDRERKLFSMKGSDYRDERMRLYVFLLSNMTDVHRFQLISKLCQEVLGGVVDNVIPLDECSIPVIQDTLAILTSKEIKLSTLRRNMGEELAEDGDEEGAVVAMAQTKIISQIVKKNVIENLIPIVIAAKHLFEKIHSPLLKDLLLCLKEIMQDFRSEVTEVLAADKQLAEEIEFDLKRVDEEEKRAARAARAMADRTPLPNTPLAQMVSPLLTPGTVGSGPPGSDRRVLTPPRLKSPTPTAAGINGKSGRTGAILAVRTPRITALKTPMPRVASPLVLHRACKPQQPPSSTEVDATPQRKPETVTKKKKEGEDRERRSDVTTPAAARARASLVNTSYVPELMTPLFTKTPQISLQRAVLPSTTKKSHTASVHTPHKAPPLQTDDTVLGGGNIGRVASTPEGLAESISFNVSSIIPPSPIPPTANPGCYLSTRRAKKLATGKAADIMMLPPTEEPRKLDKWRVKAK